ncbi:hypothetical protein [Allokutzneria sp. NRRL B-24872]|uniref:hypothetical protein n=1 Tax=Allokutzneria sp. NRRL B-24872 TaxID=1137961 RepID=UPI00117876A2|nr:hypothetical protein [Allokutzneria sp. NRRL B-24872]
MRTKLVAAVLACSLLPVTTGSAAAAGFEGKVLDCVNFKVTHKNGPFGQKYSNLYYNNHCDKQVRLRVTYKFDNPEEPGPNTSCMLAVKAKQKSDRTFDSRIISVDGNSGIRNCT